MAANEAGNQHDEEQWEKRLPDRYTKLICIQCIVTVDGPEAQSLAP